MPEEEEEVISTGPDAVMEYTAQLLAVMQEQAEAQRGVATLGQQSSSLSGWEHANDVMQPQHRM